MALITTPCEFLEVQAEIESESASIQMQAARKISDWSYLSVSHPALDSIALCGVLAAG